MGPGPLRSGWLQRYSQRSFPVASARAYTSESRSWRYTTPFSTIGFAVNDPYGRTPSAAFPVSLNVQACVSLDTFAEETVEPVASRVFARSTFEYGHEPDAPVLEPVTVPRIVVQPELALPLPPHAASSNPAMTTRAAQCNERRARARRLVPRDGHLAFIDALLAATAGGRRYAV